MSAAFDDSEEEYVRYARELARTRISARALEYANTHEYPEELFELLRSAGFFGLYHSPEWGGLGLRLRTVCQVVEELARVSSTAASMVIGQVQGSLPITIAGSPEIQQRYLPRLVRGEIRPAMALTEPEAGSDVANLSTRAVADGDDFRLTGLKCFITNVAVADIVTVFAKLESGRSTRTIQGFVVPKGTPGMTVGRMEEKMASGALPTSELVFDDCVVPAANRLGEPGSGFRAAMQVLEHVRPIIAARAVGLAQGALDDAVAYLRGRRAFGRPLAENPALQVMVADMTIAVEAARGLVLRACQAIAENDDDAGRYCAMAKAYATDMAMSVTTDAVQLFGGYGVMRDYPVEHRMREAKIGQIVDGTNQIQRLIIARSVLGVGR